MSSSSKPSSSSSKPSSCGRGHAGPAAETSAGQHQRWRRRRQRQQQQQVTSHSLSISQSVPDHPPRPNSTCPLARHCPALMCPSTRPPPTSVPSSLGQSVSGSGSAGPYRTPLQLAARSAACPTMTHPPAHPHPPALPPTRHPNCTSPSLPPTSSSSPKSESSSARGGGTWGMMKGSKGSKGAAAHVRRGAACVRRTCEGRLQVLERGCKVSVGVAGSVGGDRGGWRVGKGCAAESTAGGST